jgi:PAS domain S-box-containing protein
LILSKTGRILDVNSKTVELFGGSREELLDKRFTKIGIFSLRDIPKLSKNFAAILRGKKTFFSLYIKNKEGQTIFLECSASLTKIQGGNDVVVAVIRNVTERKKAEDAIRENQQKFERLFVGNPEAAVYVDSKFHILDANPRFEKLFRYSLDEIRDKHINNIVVPKDKTEEAEALDREAGKGHVYYDTVRMRKDGSLLPVSLSTAPIIVENQIFGHILMYKDISQLKQMEKELRDSEERLNTLFELAPDAYYLNDLRGNIVDGNRAAEELTGFRREELIGKNLLKLILLPRSQAMKAAKLLTMNTLGKATGPDELTLNRKDGTQVPVEIRTYPAKIKEKAVVLGIARDISERKNLEEKLRVVGGLTRHDVRNKLSTVTGNVYLLKRKLAGDPQALKQLNDMEAAVRLVEKIYEFARTYEKLGVEELTYIDAGKAFDEAASLFSDYGGVKAVNECRGLIVLGDSLLRQLFFNLIDDSLKYGEKIRQIKVHYRAKSMDQLELVYEDDGVGIPGDMRSHLFKEGVGKGTGYGLFMIKRICEVYGWTIQETGKHGKGARFTMTIPSSNSKGERLFKIHE